MKLLHAKCGAWLRCRKNEVSVVDDSGLWDADLWVCEECGEQIVAGFGLRPLVELHDPRFGAEAAEADYLVSR